MRRRRSSHAGSIGSHNSGPTTTTTTTTTTTCPKNNKTFQRRHSAAADEVLAATAGVDTWKTWAGRQHGSDDFEFMDIFRGMKRTITHTFLSGPPPPGTTCPVCFCEPDAWHVTTSCSHVVCVDCLQAYASNQVRDKEHSGPLKCPVCPQVLRRSDAIAALGGDSELIRLWDLKIRNQLLRALPAYRSCPHCSNENGGSGDNNNNSGGNAGGRQRESQTTNNVANGGGGFVTPECLGPHYQERRETATRVLYGLPLVSFALLALWAVMVVIISKTPSSSTMVDLLFMMIPIYSFIRAGRAAHGWVAQLARRAFLKPITVECPCCNKSFILPAESKELNDEETSRWMDAHTRPCPSCSVPIHKDGGCNHMRCGHCQANFCWACMRLRTDCAAYACRNGAPYRNAVPVPGVNNQNAGPPVLGTDSVSTIVDYLLDRPRPALDWTDGLLLFYAIFVRHFGPLQQLVEVIMALISSLFTSGFVSTVVALYVSKLTWDRLRVQLAAHRRAVAQRQQHQQQQQWRRRRSRDMTMSERLLGIDQRNERQRQRNVHTMTEREMIAEAMRRSMVEQ